MKTQVKTIIDAIRQRKRNGARLIIAIAGAPGAGKSTLAEALLAALNTDNPARAAILPMDGFHLDNAILKHRGLFEWKGAPETFDSDGFASVLARIRRGDKDVIVPGFDRELDISHAGARLIRAACEIIIVEGNYLLLDRPEWRQSAGNYDLTLLLDVPMAILEQRLIQRWLDHGLAPETAASRARGNDTANANIAIDGSVAADMTLTMTG